MFDKNGKSILIMIGKWFPANNAVSVRISNLADALVHRGYRVRIVSLFSAKFPRTESHARNGRWDVLQVLPQIPFAHILSFGLNIFSSFVFSFFALIEPYDLVIISVPPFDAALGFHLGLLLQRLINGLKTRIVYDYRDDILDESFHRELYRGLYRLDKPVLGSLAKVMRILIQSADGIVCVVERHRRMLIEKGVKASKINVIPNGVDMRLFKSFSPAGKASMRRRYGIPYGSFVLLAVSGSGWLQYNLEPILLAVRQMHQASTSSILLIIVGKKTRELRGYLKFADRLGLGHKIVHLGEVHHTEMPNILNCADIGIIALADYSFLRDALPVKLFEYCACGLPILATAPGDSLTENIVRRHSLGFVFQPNNVRGLAEAMRRLSEDDDLRCKIAAKCKTVAGKLGDRRILSNTYASMLEMHLRNGRIPSTK